MKKIIKFIFVIAVAISMASCLGTSKSSVASNRPMNADQIRLDLKMEDFQLLGEEQYNIVYRTYFGIFNFVDSLNGKSVERRNLKTISFSSFPSLNRKFTRAIAPIVEKYPQVDFITPIYSTVQSNHMFLGSKNKFTVKVKAYKFK
jgi:hypothetical protein